MTEEEKKEEATAQKHSTMRKTASNKNLCACCRVNSGVKKIRGHWRCQTCLDRTRRPSGFK